MGKFTPTEEQSAIIDACASGVDVKVEALAGTGKTTTLRLASEAMTGQKGLYMAFNKAIKAEAEATFPRHVEARTAHSLAFRPVGLRYKDRLNGPRVTSRQLADAFGVEGFGTGLITGDLSPAFVASLANSTVRRFCYSADTEIDLHHVPWVETLNRQGNQTLRAHVLPYAQDIWEDLRDVHGRYAKFGHDHYLKLWCLTKPELDADFILFDEAQDANGVMVDLVKRQQSQTIVVGDTNQQIYGWRGSTNALKHWPAEAKLSLTESFRFGPEVAAEANKWLSIPELECDLRLTGRGPSARIGPVAAPEAILCRTNAGAVRQALDALDAPGARVAIVGGGDAIRGMSLAAIDLQRGKRTTHPELTVFSTWGEVQEFVNTEDGAEDLAVFVRLVDQYGPDTLIDAVDALVDDERGRPTVTISTAHKAKGLEWSRVRIGDDFREPGLDEAGQLNRYPSDEAMLCYVAVTRAKAELDQSSLAWIDYYLAGQASPEQVARWEAKRRKEDRLVSDEFDRQMAPVVRQFKEEERQYRDGN